MLVKMNESGGGCCVVSVVDVGLDRSVNDVEVLPLGEGAWVQFQWLEERRGRVQPLM